MKTIIRILSTTLLLSLLACATLPVDTKYDKDFTFRALRTFDWLPRDMEDRHTLAPVDSRLDLVTKTALRKELLARFYRQQMSGTPDFWISYRVGPLPRTDAGDYPEQHEPGPLELLDPLGTPALGENDLIVEIIDPRSQRVVWRGWGQNLIPRNGQPMSKKTLKAVEVAVHSILDKFPPR